MKKLFCTIVLLILGYIGLQAQSCFTPVWTGNGYDHMNFYVYSAVYNGTDLQAGDEIAVFDGSSCVGRATLTGVITESNYLSIVAVQDDPGTPAKDGFTVGNTVTFRYCINQGALQVENVQPVYVTGTGLFVQGGSAELVLAGVTSTYTITASAGTGGTISPSGEVQVPSGGSQTFTITPDAGSQISDVLVNEISVGAVSSYTFSNVTGNQSISAFFITNTLPNIALNKLASAQSSLSSANLPGKAVDMDETNNSYWGAGPYPQWLKVDLGGVYNLTGIKIRNYVYGSRYYHYTVEGSIDNQNWTGIASKANNNPATNLGDSYTISATARFLRVTMTYNSTSANVYITDFKAYGTPVGHIITSSAGQGGSISPLGEVAINSGSDQIFTITPNVGYRISDVLVDNNSVGAVSSYEFQDIYANHTISASFLPMTNIALNKTATSQSALSSATMASKAVDADGTNASYWGATPYPQWMKVDLGNVFDITGIVLRNYVYGSRYYQYTIESSIDDQNYTVIATKSNTNPAIDAGDSYAVTSTARYLRVNMTYNSTSQNVYVTDFRVFGAPHVFSINSISGAGGAVSPSGIVNVNSGANQTFTITPDVGYQISNVLIDGVSAGAISSYNFNNVTADHTITAVFSAMTNVALNKTATSQSSLSSATMASKAVDADGSNSSYWGASPYPQWLKVDLGNLYNISGIVLRNYVYGSRYYNYIIEGSIDDQTYSEIASKTNSNAATNEGDSYSVNATARYLRVTMTYNSTSSNVYITDFRVYGTTLGHNIAGNAGIGGTITPSGDITVGNESDQTFTIIPGIGYQISDVLVDGNSVGAVGSYTFENVTANHTISAYFSALTSIALNKTATSQSALSSSTTANKAVDADGSNNSYFGASPYPQWLAVDLGGVYNINGIILRNYVYGSRYYQYRIEGSIDGQSFTEIVSKTNTNPATNEGDSYMVDATARYLRVVMTYNSTGSGVYITDFRVFGTLQGGGKGSDAENSLLPKGEIEEENVQGEYKLNVYPNPFIDQLSVRIDSPEEETFRLAIINLNGKIVHNVPEIQSNSDNVIYPELAKGMYILEVKNNYKRMVYRIIKF